mmetsp:Transcript_14272/g.61148  ORF Transcript_14272/g.61148 Transcript_14272/m.61148 type:complete len:254 (+) Transcript_14272:1652-2413(+)
MQQAHQRVGVVRRLGALEEIARVLFVCVVDESKHGHPVAVRAQARHREARPARRRRGRPGVLRRDEHRLVSRVRKPARRPRVTAPSPSRSSPRASALLRLDGANRARAEDALELILRLHAGPVNRHQRVSFRGQSVCAVRAAKTSLGKIVKIVRRNRRRRHLLAQLAERRGDLIHRVVREMRHARLLLLLLLFLLLLGAAGGVGVAAFLGVIPGLGGGVILHLELFLHLRGGLGRVLGHDTWERTGRGRASGA